MNERIKKLAEQVGATIGEGFDGTKGFVYGITMSPEELEKFAELIVQETIKQMAIQMDKFGDDQSNNPAWYKSEEAVKKQLRVRE